jgi:glycine reductase
MSERIRVLHFLNPFFAGFGGEEANDMAPRVEAGPRGPGIRLTQLVGDGAEVVATAVVGDNYFAEHEAASVQAVCAAARAHRADVVVAGPAFHAGRYGLACGAVCKGITDELGIPAVTGLYPENPGAAFRRKGVYIVPTGDSARFMGEAIPKIAALALKLARREPMRSAAEEGYLPRGLRWNERVDHTSSRRAVDMLLKKLRGEPFETEILLEDQERVPPAPPLHDVRDAVVALATEAGLIPHGNPDRIPSARALVWGKYSIAAMEALSPGQFSFIHGGYDTTKVNENPNRGVPVDAMRDLEASGEFKKLVDEVLSTCGNGGSLNEMKRIGQEMAVEAKRQGATAVILPAT